MSSSVTGDAVADRRASMTRDLLERRFPQYLAVYLGGSWGLIEFFAFLEDRFLLSPHWTNLVMLMLVLLLPSVALFIYFHGSKGADRWHRIEKVAIPANVAFTLLILFTAFSGKDLGAMTTTVLVEDEEGAAVERVVAKHEFRKTLALFTPYADSTDADQAWLGYAVYNGLVNDLFQDIFLNLRPSALFRDRIREAGFASDGAVPRTLKRRIAADMNVPYFVDGVAARSGDGFRLTLTLNDTERGRVLTERVHEGDDLFALIDSASIQLRRDLDLPARHLEETPDMPVTEHTTTSLEALRHYAAAMRALLVHDDYPTASAALDAALDTDPTFADAAYTLFQVRMLMGDMSGAIGALQVAMDNLYRLPERSHYAVKGEWYGAQQDFPRMFAVYEMWAELYPDDITAQSTVARMRLFQDDRPGAIEAYERVLRLDPTQIDVLPQIGALYEAMGEPAEARRYYERHVEEAPEDESSLKALAGLYRRTGEHDAARDQYERALLLEPGDPSLLRAVASLDRDLGRFEEALAGYQTALEAARTAEQRASALFSLSGHHRARGERRKALEYQERALDEAASFAPPVSIIQGRLINLDLYVHVGRSEEALELLEMLRAQLPPPLDALVPIGRMNVYEALERPDELAEAVQAGVAMLEATGMNSLQQPVLYFTGRLHEMRGEWAEALATYEQERDHDPTDSSIATQMGRCHRELGNLERAESLIRETLAVVPSNGRAHYELALVYQRMNRRSDAVAHLERALETWAPADEDYVWAARARARLAELRT